MPVALLNAALVSVVLAWTSIRALSQYSKIDAVRRPAITMLSLLIVQLCLGFTAFITRVAWGHDAVQPELPMVVSTVAHVAVGALLLATSIVLFIQVRRNVPAAVRESVRQLMVVRSWASEKAMRRGDFQQRVIDRHSSLNRMREMRQ